MQLDKAVEVLQQTVVAWKKEHATIAMHPAAAKPAATARGPQPARAPAGK
jgi:hypothetical protein